MREFLKSVGVAAALACAVTVASAQVVIVEHGPMPPARVEVIPAAPGLGWNGVPGHWAWRGRWEWIAGHHIHAVVPAMPAEVVEVAPATPGAGYFWVKGHHVWEDGRWVWHRGVWAR